MSRELADQITAEGIQMQGQQMQTIAANNFYRFASEDAATAFETYVDDYIQREMAEDAVLRDYYGNNPIAMRQRKNQLQEQFQRSYFATPDDPTGARVRVQYLGQREVKNLMGSLFSEDAEVKQAALQWLGSIKEDSQKMEELQMKVKAQGGSSYADMLPLLPGLNATLTGKERDALFVALKTKVNDVKDAMTLQYGYDDKKFKEDWSSRMAQIESSAWMRNYDAQHQNEDGYLERRQGIIKTVAMASMLSQSDHDKFLGAMGQPVSYSARVPGNSWFFSGNTHPVVAMTRDNENDRTPEIIRDIFSAGAQQELLRSVLRADDDKFRSAAKTAFDDKASATARAEARAEVQRLAGVNIGDGKFTYMQGGKYITQPLVNAQDAEQLVNSLYSRMMVDRAKYMRAVDSSDRASVTFINATTGKKMGILTKAEVAKIGLPYYGTSDITEGRMD